METVYPHATGEEDALPNSTQIVTQRDDRMAENNELAPTRAQSTGGARVLRAISDGYTRVGPIKTAGALVVALGCLILLAMHSGQKSAPTGKAALATAQQDLADLEDYARQAPGGDVSAPTTPQPEVRQAIAVSSIDAAAAPGTPAVAPVSQLCNVVGLDPGDSLNLRSGPGVQNSILLRLPSGYSGVEITGDTVANGSTLWVPVKVGEIRGWVVRKNLYP